MPLGLFGGIRTDQPAERDGATVFADGGGPLGAARRADHACDPDMNEVVWRLTAGSERAAESA